MNKYSKQIATAAVIALFAPWANAADAVYDAGEAAEINANTSTIGTLTPIVISNGAAVVSNATNIGTNSSNIATIVPIVISNGAAVVSNATDIATNTSNITTNTSNIAVQQSLISLDGLNTEGNQIVSIGDNSLKTQEFGGEQLLYAEDGANQPIDIVVTNGSNFKVQAPDTPAVPMYSGAGGLVNPAINDADTTDKATPVLTFLGSTQTDKTTTTNSGVELTEEGNGFFRAATGTEWRSTIASGTVVNINNADQNNGQAPGTPDLASQRYIPGYFTDGMGNVVAPSVVEASLDPSVYTFNALPLDPLAPGYDPGQPYIAGVQDFIPAGYLTQADLDAYVASLDPEVIALDLAFAPIVESNALPGAGGNITVEGTSTVDGDSSVGGILSLAAGDPDGIPASGDEWAAVANVAEAIGDNSTAIASNNTNIVTNASNIASNNTNIVTNASNIASNNTKIVSNATSIVSNRSLITSNNTNIVANTSAIDIERSTRISEDADIRFEFRNADTAIISGYQAADANLQSQIDGLDKRVDENARGIAMVAALQHTTVLPGMTNALDVGAAHFEGETGLSINFARRINENWQINFGAASTTDFDESVIKAGVGVQW